MAKVPAATTRSPENASSVQPSTEVSKVSSTSKTPSAPPPTAAVSRGAPPLKKSSISQSTDAVGKVVPASSNAVIPPLTIEANKVATALNDAEILAISAATDNRLPVSSTAPVSSPTSVLTQGSSALNETAAIAIEKTSPASNTALVPSPASTGAQISTALNPTAGPTGGKSPPVSKTAPIPPPKYGLAQVSPALNTTAATAAGKSLKVSNTVPVSSPTATVVQISLALNTVATSQSMVGLEKPAPVSNNALVPSPIASLAKDRLTAKPPLGPLSMIVDGKVFSRPETAHLDPSSSSGAEGFSTKNTATSLAPLTSIDGASPTHNKTIIPTKSSADANGVPAQNVSSGPPPPALAANAPPVQIKPPVLPTTTSIAEIASAGNTAPISPFLAAIPQTTSSKLMVAPFLEPAPSEAKAISTGNMALVLSTIAGESKGTCMSEVAMALPSTTSVAQIASAGKKPPFPPYSAAVPKITSKLKAVPDIPPTSFTVENDSIRNTAPGVPPAASAAKTYPVQKPTPASQFVKTALKKSTSSVLPPGVSAAKALPAPDISPALKNDGKGLGSLPDSGQAKQQSPLIPMKSVGDVASQKAHAEPTLSTNLAGPFKRLKIELESTVAEAVGKKGMKIAFLMVEIEHAEKLLSSTKELLNIKQKTVASMEVVIKGLRELGYGPQKLREKEHQISALKCEIEILQKRLQSTGEQIKFKEEEIPTLKIEIECLKKSYFNTMKLEKARDQNFARLKVEIEKVKTSQKAAEKMLDVKEDRIVELQAQIESCTGSLQTAEKMIELKGKETLGLKAALAFKTETDELKNARGNRDLDLLDKRLKQINTLQLEIERLKKSQRGKDNVARDDQEVPALKLEIERLKKSQQKKNVVIGNDTALKTKTADLQRYEKDKTEHLGNSKDGECKPAMTKSSKVQVVSETPKPGDPRKNDLMGPLIYFTNDELGIPTYDMDFEASNYMPNEQKKVGNDSSEPEVQAFTATGTGIQIHFTQTISWRAVILLLLAFLLSFLRILVLHGKNLIQRQ